MLLVWPLAYDYHMLILLINPPSLFVALHLISHPFLACFLAQFIISDFKSPISITI
jgi:hypothetical protein